MERSCHEAVALGGEDLRLPAGDTRDVDDVTKDVPVPARKGREIPHGRDGGSIQSPHSQVQGTLCRSYRQTNK